MFNHGVYNGPPIHLNLIGGGLLFSFAFFFLLFSVFYPKKGLVFSFMTFFSSLITVFFVYFTPEEFILASSIIISAQMVLWVSSKKINKHKALLLIFSFFAFTAISFVVEEGLRLYVGVHKEFVAHPLCSWAQCLDATGQPTNK